MKYITIKEFQKNVYASLKELPVVITKRGKAFLKIESFKDEISHEVKKEIHEFDLKDDKFSDVKKEGYHFVSMLNKYVKD